MKSTKIWLPLLASLSIASPLLAEKSMDEMWGERATKLRSENPDRGKLFIDGKYAMFIHWGLYSTIGNQYKDKTYYGIGEWIMHSRMAGIPIPEYKDLAKDFNPVDFDAKAIAQLAKDAGMKYIIITSKHHDGFAMYHSKSNNFNIVDATPYGKDPMKELAQACRDVGIGFGFYYSHNQDWTYPGGGAGPQTDADGNPASFDTYFAEKCLPQVEEITSEYGPIELVWFDTPAGMPKEYVQQLVDVVRKNQPNAMVSGRAGHGLGDYQSLGDMEVPNENVEGLWEAVDTTNDSWAYAWYDQNWKTPKEILHRVVSCTARGGTYMLNIGPDATGAVPEYAIESLRDSGAWIKKYPQVIYAAQPSPWEHALPWGDVTVQGNKLHLSVFDWPTSGELWLPGLKTEIKSAKLLSGAGGAAIEFAKVSGWTKLSLPIMAPEKYASVIEIELASAPEVDSTYALDPEFETSILSQFATVTNAKEIRDRWMEKFGEWKVVHGVGEWKEGGKATWEVDVVQPGTYHIDLSYKGGKRPEGGREVDRVVWKVSVEGGDTIQNQQNSSHNYQYFPMGWLEFPEAGRYKVSASCIEGNLDAAVLKAIRFVPLD
ncbi:MAG: alpha-L-fucosidase [Akkermansiaceae bacterium]